MHLYPGLTTSHLWEPACTCARLMGVLHVSSAEKQTWSTRYEAATQHKPIQPHFSRAWKCLMQSVELGVQLQLGKGRHSQRSETRGSLAHACVHTVQLQAASPNPCIPCTPSSTNYLARRCTATSSRTGLLLVTCGPLQPRRPCCRLLLLLAQGLH